MMKKYRASLLKNNNQENETREAELGVSGNSVVKHVQAICGRSNLIPPTIP